MSKHLNITGCFLFLSFFFQTILSAQNTSIGTKDIVSGEVWKDTDGNVINAHGGGILFNNGKYYWFGEHRPSSGFTTQVGVTCYSSTDLRNWKYEGVALAVSDEAGSDIEKGCIIERPKVIYNQKTGKYVMWFHLELKGRGYGPSRAGVAVSDTPAGPYRFIRSGRVNPGVYPLNMTQEEKKLTWNPKDYEWWTPEWREAVNKGMFVKRDLEGDGQMSRDMTLFVDDDGTAYHIYSSEENSTLHISQLTDDYTSYSGKYARFFPGRFMEAPALFKQKGKYYLIMSGCTGWAPNAGRSAVASSIWGPWKELENPFRGENSEVSFYSQSTYVLPVPGHADRFIYMGDRWTPENAIDGRYIWLPIRFEGEQPVIEWRSEWSY